MCFPKWFTRKAMGVKYHNNRNQMEQTAGTKKYISGQPKGILKNSIKGENYHFNYNNEGYV